MSRRADLRRKQREQQQRRTRRLWFAFGGVGAVVTAVLIGLALRAQPTPSSAATPQRVVVSTGGGSIGQSASFTAITLAGKTFRVPAGHPTVLYFMAGWCSTCRPEAQALGQIAAQQSGKVAILAVDADPTDSLASLDNFIQQVGNPGYAFVQDDNGAMVQAFGVAALDTTVVLDASGKVVYRNTTPIDVQTLNAALAQASS